MDAKSLTSASLAAWKSAIGAKVDTARRAHYDLGAYLDEARLIEFVGITSAYWSPAHEDLSDVGFTTIVAGKSGERLPNCGCDERGCVACLQEPELDTTGHWMWHGAKRHVG